MRTLKGIKKKVTENWTSIPRLPNTTLAPQVAQSRAQSKRKEIFISVRLRRVRKVRQLIEQKVLRMKNWRGMGENKEYS